MKKILMALLLIGCLSVFNRASAQKVTYYYYPEANVYYNPHTHEYAYSDNDNWRYNRDLPSNYHIGKRHVTVYGNSDQIIKCTGKNTRIGIRKMSKENTGMKKKKIRRK